MSKTQKHTKPNVPNLRFPGFEGEWESRKIGEDCSVLMCKRIFANQTSEQGDVPFYKIGTIGAEADAFISKELFDEYKAKYNYPRRGEVMITCAGTVGKTTVFNGDDSYFQDSNIVWLSNPKQLYINSFLNYYLTRVNWDKLNSTTITRIYNDNLRELVIKYPSIKEQEKIVSLFSLLDQRIAVQSKVIECYESLIKALIDQQIDSLLGGNMIPFEHLYVKAGEGGTPATSVKEYYHKGSIPFIKIDDLSSMFLTENKDYISELGLEKSSAWLIPEGSVIFSNGATIGAISINTYPVSTKQGILGIVPQNTVTKEYLYFLMRSSFFSKEILRIVTEGTMKTAYLKDINRIECPLPSINIQNKVVSGLLTLTEKIEFENHIMEKLLSAKRALLNQMFI